MPPAVMANIPALKDSYLQLKSRMDKAVADFQSNLASTRTGRASIQMLDQIRVDYYGTPTPLSSIGQLTTPDANMIVIQPWEPSLIGEIEKALRASDQHYNPQNDGKVVRVPIPPMTEERRREVVKHLSKVLEDHRTAVRNIRRDGNDVIKKASKDKLISADEEKRSLDEMQKLTDEEIRKMEEMSKKKEAEVMQI
ncbi:ribosome recycling factor [Silvibacterium dinghuense]|uniref:Ribosome-recycling factor n=1 Tax=Silvibacterium dinghuense TaxID=1560006 RepID=A0A4Q1S8U6_9BACT|nr:ribosome recycling factor [Silvibacterium dinghuense]RXS93315.1 ribosome recycling factor [Silvibacterium dinghuense]GGH04837.1 ribosome-recycling factor [Silvibacterium dinghuense]